jgi:hypothetical protein
VAYEAKFGQKPVFDEKASNHGSRIRSYARYPQVSARAADKGYGGAECSQE